MARPRALAAEVRKAGTTPWPDATPRPHAGSHEARHPVRVGQPARHPGQPLALANTGDQDLSSVPVSPFTSLGAGKVDNLLVKVTLPGTADNDFQGLSSVVSFSFTGTQRGAVAR